MIALLGAAALIAISAGVLVYEMHDGGASRPIAVPAPVAQGSPHAPVAPAAPPPALAEPVAPAPAADPAPAPEPAVTTTDLDQTTRDGLAALASAMAQHHWPDAAAECANSQVAAAGADSCTLAACQMHDLIRARQYYAGVGSDRRADVKSACADLHIPVERPFGHLPFRSRFRHGG